jgi:hypothetical protein
MREIAEFVAVLTCRVFAGAASTSASSSIPPECSVG